MNARERFMDALRVFVKAEIKAEIVKGAPGTVPEGLVLGAALDAMLTAERDAVIKQIEETD